MTKQLDPVNSWALKAQGSTTRGAWGLGPGGQKGPIAQNAAPENERQSIGNAILQNRYMFDKEWGIDTQALEHKNVQQAQNSD